MGMKSVIFDMDGTLSNSSGRAHLVEGPKKDWNEFFRRSGEDSPYEHIVELLQMLGLRYRILIVTGRSENWRSLTVGWMREQGIRWDALFMRAEGDHRPDFEVKEEILDRHILARGERPVMAFDDRDSVVAMWRRRGIPCLQVAEGNF